MNSSSNTNDVVIAFAAMPWREAAPFCRVKEIQRGNQRVRLVEFLRGFDENGWCENGHIGYVLEGALEVEFSDGAVTAKSGDCLWIAAGAAHKHRARVLGEVVRLVLFEEVSANSDHETNPPPDAPINT